MTSLEIILCLIALAMIASLFKIKHKKSLLQQENNNLTQTTENLQERIATSHKHNIILRQKHRIEMESWKITQEKIIRADANQRSRATLRGQATEHLAPYMMEGLCPKDFRFVGDPIDYLICVGSSGIHDRTTDQIEEVILLDIKTGKADLSKVQRRIRDAVTAGRVRFMTYNTDTETTRSWPAND